MKWSHQPAPGIEGLETTPLDFDSYFFFLFSLYLDKMASADKKPVGFATHIIAGGIAGMSEAVGRSG